MLLFNGSLHNKRNTFNGNIYQHVLGQCNENQLPVNELDISEIDMPHFNPYSRKTPDAVQNMLDLFLSEDKQIWLAPLYHGSIPGIMKNALDWLQLTSKNPSPYLTDKIIGLICIADGLFAIQGINAMNAIAHNLRAWVLPYTLPINKSEAEIRNSEHLAMHYRQKIRLMVQLLGKADTKEIN
ncbi:MAG TPA: NAD(P)H-dependent oxidoreductase [Balneolaceae bacterium]|nr:NAD(P)H-dependent oxidoreductase [Balneolaceae bacterium]